MSLMLVPRIICCIGGPGSTSTRMFPPCTINVSEPSGKAKKVHDAYDCPFQINEAYFSDAALFDELAEDGEIASAQPRSMPPLDWDWDTDNIVSDNLMCILLIYNVKFIIFIEITYFHYFILQFY